MIQGIINANLEPIIPLTLLADDGSHISVDAVMDTGFNGYLTLPADLITLLNLVEFDRQLRQLADGQQVITRLYIARVLWGGKPVVISVEDGMGSPLVGMELLLNHQVSLEVRNGGPVSITPAVP